MSILSTKINRSRRSILSEHLKVPKKSNKCVKTSKKAIKWLGMIEKYMNIKLQMGDETGKGEFYIIGMNGYRSKIYFDGYCQETNTVYEFHGCKWHNCLLCFPNSKSEDKDLYFKTIEREQFIISKGYKLYRIWEHEFDNYIKGKELQLGQYIE